MDRSPASGFISLKSGAFVLLWGSVLLASYGPLIFHPQLHSACPENDTWNLPIRWSVLNSLREGHLPLWNSLPAFGIPWLATWQTESFYPGTILFVWKGLAAWNFSGILHLCLFSAGIVYFLRLLGVLPFWALLVGTLSLMNGCAYNHLGSNASMDTMAWIPWCFSAVHELLDLRPLGRLKLALFLTLQIFAGYPQTVFYTLAGLVAYALLQKGWRGLQALAAPLSGALVFSACQWIPSLEYFFLNAARLPAIPDNPHFYLPMGNLKTFYDFNALAKPSIPDYVASPTFFYFNFYSGLMPLALLAMGLLFFKTLKPTSRFFLIGFFLLILWALGLFLRGVDFCHIPIPAFLEPAKCWVLINVFELFTLGFVLNDLLPNPGKWKWGLLAISILNLLIPLKSHPLEKNLIPPDARLEAQAQTIRTSLGSGRVLILPDAKSHAAYYTPLPDPQLKGLFKYFLPNSNLFASLPAATFYGSTQPSWGALDAGLYYEYGFPYEKGTLLDVTGVDLLLLNAQQMPPRFKKIWTQGTWTLWKNPSSLGSHFIFSGPIRRAGRKEIFSSFASGSANPSRDLYLDSLPVSKAPLSPLPPLESQTLFYQGDPQPKILVVTQNALPGWRAWVHGIPADIFLADGMFQGIPIEGTGEVQLSYEPASFRFGLFLSLIGLAGAGLFWRARKNP